jgi:hypothetical protein
MMSTQDEVRSVLTSFFEEEGERIYQTVLQLNRSSAAGATRSYSESEVEQMVRGFRTMLLEELRGEQTETRAYLLEVLMPGFVAQGDPVSNIVQWNTTFMTLLACEVAAHAPEGLRAQVASWYAHYTGLYVADVARVAYEAAALLKQRSALDD